MKFDNWLDVFLEEKEIEGITFEIEHEEMIHFVEQEVLIDFIKSMPKEIKKKIKDQFVIIDFKNGDCVHYLNHLASGMVKATFN